LHDFEALKSETVDWFNWNNFRVRMNKKSLDLNPLFLLFCEIMRSLSLFNFTYEFINDNRNEQIHDEESSDENIDDEY